MLADRMDCSGQLCAFSCCGLWFRAGRGGEVMMSGIVQGTKPSGPEPVG